MTDPIAEFLDIEGVEDREILERIKNDIRAYAASRPRSIQTDLGPSEIGTDCMRQLAYGLTATGKVNVWSDPWRSIVGIALHSWMEGMEAWVNDKESEIVYIPEARLYIRAGLAGTCDCYYVPAKTVLDWKFPGSYGFKKFKNEGPGQKYQVQRQTYGLGYENLGFDVQRVGNLVIPPSGRLNDAILDTEPYDRSIAETALQRMDDVKEMIREYDVVHKPENFALIPIAPSDDCRLCGYWSPDPQGPRQCPGKTEEK